MRLKSTQNEMVMIMLAWVAYLIEVVDVDLVPSSARLYWDLIELPQLDLFHGDLVVQFKEYSQETKEEKQTLNARNRREQHNMSRVFQLQLQHNMFLDPLCQLEYKPPLTDKKIYRWKSNSILVDTCP